MRRAVLYNPDTGEMTWAERGPEDFGGPDQEGAEAKSRRFNSRWAGGDLHSTILKGRHYVRAKAEDGRSVRVVKAELAWLLGGGPELTDRRTVVSLDNSFSAA